MTKKKNKARNTVKAPEKKKEKTTLNFLTNQNFKKVTGLFLLLFSIYLFISFSSYIFTWKVDQDKVANASFFSFVFQKQPFEIQNLLGKLGAITSHRIVYNGFGIISFLIPFYLLLLSSKILFDFKPFPLLKTLKIGFVTLVWTSIFLGFIFSTNYLFMGGRFGYFINDWLNGAVGKIGAFFLILFSFVGITSILFNVSWSKLSIAFSKLLKIKKDVKDSNIKEVNKNTVKDNFDIKIINSTTDDQIQEDKITPTFDFSDSLSDHEEDKNTELEIENTFQNSTDDLTPEDEGDDEDDFTIEVAEVKEEILSDKEIHSKVKEFGEYDPTLDLSAYQLPTVDLLNDYGGTGNVNIDKTELEANKNKIVETLSHYKIEISKIKATIGPTVTLYELIPAPGIRISKIKNLEDDIALSLSALGIRIIAPIPGKGTIGIEVPNSKPDAVAMRTLLSSDKFQNSDYELPIALGKTISNETFIADLAKMPHLLMAGATGQGKSVGLNAILVSILYKKHPSQVKFVLVDPKKVELTLFNKIERHFLAKLPDEEEPIITDTSKVVTTLNSLCVEMDTRYDLLKKAHVRNLKEYNKKFIERRLNPENGHRFLPYIVLVVDEFADLIMTAGKEVELPIARLAQLARAIGIHLIIATQRPSVNIITGMIKANFPSRIAFRVTSKIDSRTILDTGGADQLIGRGDMLFSNGNDLVRLQCGFVDTPEVEKICEFIGEQRAYPSALLLPEYIGEGDTASPKEIDEDRDELFEEAARVIVLHQQGSASLIQRKLKLGYNRAGRLIDQLEAVGIVGPFEGSKARKVLIPDEISLEQFLNSLTADTNE